MNQTAQLERELTPSDAERILRRMILIRKVEEAMIDLYRKNLIPGFIHPGIGEEAVDVGVCDHLDESDHIVATHRGHGQALAKGIDPKRMLAEVLGKRDGPLGGRGGSLHVGDWSRGILPASPLVGGGLGTMTGIALAHALDKDGGVAVCFFGDGAVNRGAFHEAVNMASLWKLPIVYACIDNGWAISVPRNASTAGDYLDRASGYGIPGQIVDGKDVLSCRSEAGTAIARARRGDGPTLLFFDCPRGYGHEEGDAQHYRPRDDYEAARARDPIQIATNALSELALMDKSRAEHITRDVDSEVREAIEFAEQSPLPEPSQAFEHVRPGA
jgi:TPP-dependent pyruvate/acetoin dehydrogenase alpha subunit